MWPCVGIIAATRSICLHARRKRADSVVQMQGTGSADGRQPESLRRMQRISGQLRDLVGFPQCPELGEGGACADIGAEPYAHRAFWRQCFEKFEETAAKKQIGSRTVRQTCRAFMATTELLFANMDAMTKDAAGTDQPGMIDRPA